MARTKVRTGSLLCFAFVVKVMGVCAMLAGGGDGVFLLLGDLLRARQIYCERDEYRVARKQLNIK